MAGKGGEEAPATPGNDTVVEVPNEDDSKGQPWRKWLHSDNTEPSADKPWIGWKPDPQNESDKPWVEWIKSAGVAGAGPSGNAGG